MELVYEGMLILSGTTFCSLVYMGITNILFSRKPKLYGHSPETQNRNRHKIVN